MLKSHSLKIRIGIALFVYALSYPLFSYAQENGIPFAYSDEESVPYYQDNPYDEAYNYQPDYDAPEQSNGSYEDANRIDFRQYECEGFHPEWIYHWTDKFQYDCDAEYKDCCDYIDEDDFFPTFDWDVSYRFAYYYPTNKKVRKIYSSHWLDYGLELSIGLFDTNWHFWASANVASKNGHSYGDGHRDTRATVYPFAMGLKYYYFFTRRLNVYLGAGISYSFCHIRDRSHDVKTRSSGETVGGLVKSGLQYNLDIQDWDIFIEGFADYIYQDFHFSHGRHNVKRHDADFSGVKVGVGIGMYF